MMQARSMALCRSAFSRFAVFGFVLCAAMNPVATESDAAETDGSIETFLSEYCINCHSVNDPGGEREFETLDLQSIDDDAFVLTQDIIDQLTLGHMPPEDAEQPSDDVRRVVIDALTKQLHQRRSMSTSTGGQTVLRRLSKREYLATIADLFEMDMSMFDPTVGFPRDNTVEHLDNIGDSLVMSSYLLEKYLDAADQIIEKVFQNESQPEEQSWHFDDRFVTQQELSIAHRKAFNYRYMCLYDCPLADKPEGAYGSVRAFEHGVPHDGIYEIRVRAQALHRDSPYDLDRLRIDLNEKFRLGIRPGNIETGELHVVQPIQPLLAETVVEDNELKWYTFEIPLDRGYTPRFTFENGMDGMRSLHTRFHRIYKDMLPPEARGGRGIVAGRNAMLKFGKMPQIRIHEISIRGPLKQDWPRTPLASVLPDGTFVEDNLQSVLKRFASKAFRRPVTDDELDRLIAIYQTRRRHGRPEFEAMKDTLKSVLCSPAFLYFHPECEPGSDRLSSHAVAERLSYFLTGSMPDASLRKRADRGAFDDQTLVSETRRLLNSNRLDGFVEGFVDAWLGLRSLGEMPPDRNQFWQYYASDLETDMKRESQLFLRHTIENDLPVTEWLSADYSFLNRDLARLYGELDQVPPQNATRFRQVRFSDPRRGGLLGQAGILTVSANGIETSPVVRGVWMLENVLGTPPPPPPDDVPAIDPDVRGAKGIRDLLAKHRTLDACNQCHRKIDPLGFALECYDAIGRARNRYPNRSPIDTSGKLPGGESFEGPSDLKHVLLEQKEFFARAFTTKLLAYALGRRIEPEDRATIDEILVDLKDQDYPTRQIIERVVTSDAFARR